MRIDVLNRLVRAWRATKIYWRYRHLARRGVWDQYISDSTNARRRALASKAKSLNIRSVFEFGCGSGPNLLALRNEFEGGGSLELFGFDVSKEAIRSLDDVGVTGIFRSGNFDGPGQLDFLPESLDLVILDRVCYLLNDREFATLLNEIRMRAEWVYINDFSDNVVPEVADYRVRNYRMELSKHDFTLANSEAVMNKTSGTDFFSKYSKELWFKRSSP